MAVGGMMDAPDRLDPMVFVSLIVKERQSVPAGRWTALRFNAESADGPGWHDSNDLDSPGSALIVPDWTGPALVAGMVHWAAPADLVVPPTQYLARITRDPYDPDLIDSTATHDRAPTPGAQYDVFCWPMMVRAGQPLALMVNHNGSNRLDVTLAEFKVVTL